MDFAGCYRCEKCWEKYQQALVRDLRLTEIYKAALLRYDRPTIRAIITDVADAKRRRYELRDALFAHANSHLPRVAAGPVFQLSASA